MRDGGRRPEVPVLLDGADVVEDESAAEAVEVGERGERQHRARHAPGNAQVAGAPAGATARHSYPAGHLISSEMKILQRSDKFHFPGCVYFCLALPG